MPGWTTIMVLVALCATAQLLMMGILGEYVGRIYEEVKRRPLYTVAERINFGDATVRRTDANLASEADSRTLSKS